MVVTVLNVSLNDVEVVFEVGSLIYDWIRVNKFMSEWHFIISNFLS